MPGSIPGGTTPPFIMSPAKTSVGVGFLISVNQAVRLQQSHTKAITEVNKHHVQLRG